MALSIFISAVGSFSIGKFAFVAHFSSQTCIGVVIPFDPVQLRITCKHCCGICQATGRTVGACYRLCLTPCFLREMYYCDKIETL